MEADNFAGQATDWVLDRDRLVADLADYDRDMGQANRDLVLAHHDAADHARALVALFRPASRRGPKPAHRAAAQDSAARAPAVGLEQDVIALRQALLEERARAVIAEDYAAALVAERERLDAEVARLTEPRRWRAR